MAGPNKANWSRSALAEYRYKAVFYKKHSWPNILALILTLFVAEALASEGILYQVSPEAKETFDLFETPAGSGAPVVKFNAGEFTYATEVLDGDVLSIPAYDRNGEYQSLYVQPAAVGANKIEESFDGKKIYVDLPSGEQVTLERDPRVNPIQDLIENPEPRATIDNSAEVKVFHAALAERMNPKTEKWEWRNYYYIEAKLSDGRKVQGWLDSSYLSHEPRDERRPRPERENLTNPDSDEECGHETGSGSGYNTDSIDEIAGLIEGLEDFSVESATESVLPHVGNCLSKGTADSSLRKKVVDQYKDKKLPKLTKADGTPMTPNDWAAIDVMARTLYGEILGFGGECFRKGDHYPEAVAKVILNRNDLIKSSNTQHANAAKARFLKKDASRTLPNFIRLMISPSQFNIWSDEKPSRMALCPPKSTDAKFYTGGYPPQKEVDWWQKAVKIATEVVMNEQGFKKRTGDMKALYYTSNVQRDSGWTRLWKATTGGRKITYEKCLMFWEEEDLEKVLEK